jgi:hypothetical protein
MTAIRALLIAAVALLVAMPVVAAAQGVVPQAGGKGEVRIESRAGTPAEREARVVAPPLHYETTRPPDADVYPYPQGVKVEHDPAFIEPLAGRYETTSGSGRFGLSGWTSPNPPVGSPVSGWRDVSGWFALGFSVTWDGPPAPKARPR